MAGTRKHDWTRIFATLREDGWTPTSEGKTSLRSHADALGIVIGTLAPKVVSERKRPGGGLLAPPVVEPPAPKRRKRAAAVDPDAD